MLWPYGIGPGSSRTWIPGLGGLGLARCLGSPWVGTQDLPPGAVVPRLIDTHQHAGHSPGGVGGVLGQHENGGALDRRWGPTDKQVRWRQKWVHRIERVEGEWKFFEAGSGQVAGAESQGAEALCILPEGWGEVIARRQG